MANMDLNSDAGESFGRWTLGDDTAMFRSVSSANLACGFHAGDPSVIRLAEAAGLRAVTEAFAYRAYNPDGTLVSRTLSGAVLKDPALVTERVLRMATDSAVRTVDGSILKISAESICVHGDSPGAVTTAAAVRKALTATGTTTAAFA